jgi:hypothetical protein
MSGMVYSFKGASQLPKSLNAQSIGEELERVREESGEGFSPRAVVEAARDEGSALHPAVFDCTEAEAAEKHWEERASYIVRMIVVTYEDDANVPKRTNAFVSVIEHETLEPRYLPVFVALADEDYRQQMVEQALGVFVQARHKYAEYKEFARVFAAIDETVAEMSA